MDKIVYTTNNKTGYMYAYRVEQEIDPETGKKISHRVYLGRVNPETKEILPKAENGKRNRTPIIYNRIEDDKVDPAELEAMEALIAERQRELQELQKTIEILTKQQETMDRVFKEIANAITQFGKDWADD